MPRPAYPSLLTAAAWDKQKSLPARPTGMGAALKQLQKLHEAIDPARVDAPAPGTAAAAGAQLQALDALQGKAVKALADQAKAVAELAKRYQAELKKAPDARAITAQAARVGEEAARLATDTARWVEGARAAAKAAVAKLAAAGKKGEKAEKAAQATDDKGDDKLAGADEKLVRTRVVAAMRLVRNAKPGAPVIHFVMAVGGKKSLAYLGSSVGASHRNLLKRLLPGEASLKYFTGECVWEAKAWTFVGDNVPGGGLVKKLQQSLFELTGVRYRLRMRKPTGEAEEADGDEEVCDPHDDAPAAEARGAGTTAARDRLLALQPRIKAALAGPAAAEVKAQVARCGALVKARDAAGAAKAVDTLQALLERTARATRAPTPAGGEQAGPSPQALEQARLAWATVRQKAVRGIESLAGRLQELYHDMPQEGAAVQAARARLLALGGKLQPELELRLAAAAKTTGSPRAAAVRLAREALASTEQLIASEPLMADLDGNELMPELRVVAPMRTALRGVAAALA